MTRGDTLRVQIGIEDVDTGEEYVPVQGDSVRFAMKETYEDETPLVIKDIPIDTMELTLEPEDTKSLPMGQRYVYDLQITFANGDVYTFVDKATLKLTEEVD